MAKKKEEAPTPVVHAVGDKVVWKGITLTIMAIRENGYIECWSPHMQLTVDSHDLLEKSDG